MSERYGIKITYAGNKRALAEDEHRRPYSGSRDEMSQLIADVYAWDAFDAKLVKLVRKKPKLGVWRPTSERPAEYPCDLVIACPRVRQEGTESYSFRVKSSEHFDTLRDIYKAFAWTLVPELPVKP